MYELARLKEFTIDLGFGWTATVAEVNHPDALACWKNAKAKGGVYISWGFD